jgi:hypothetical protein
MQWCIVTVADPTRVSGAPLPCLATSTFAPRTLFGKYAAAEQLCVQAFAAYDAVTPTNANALGRAAALNNFAILRLNQQQPSVAEPLLKRVLDILEDSLLRRRRDFL